MDAQPYHIPALLERSLDALSIEPSGVYVDCTLGGGGHTLGILGRLGEEGRLLSFDQDSEAISRAALEPRLGGDRRLTLVHGNFRYLRNFLRYHKALPVDGILADLGVSFHHFDDPDRGFSFRWDGALDMRMNRDASRDASAVIADATEEELAGIFHLYGELRQARRMAAAIVKAREQGAITTVQRLLDVISPFVNPRQEKKELAQVFQALRIEVNNEMDALRQLLVQSREALRPGGRIAVITYHSLEDRMVKNFLKTGNLDGRDEKDFFGRSLSPFRLLASKPVVPNEEEIAANPRSRSAKLRVAEKLYDKDFEGR